MTEAFWGEKKEFLFLSNDVSLIKDMQNIVVANDIQYDQHMSEHNCVKASETSLFGIPTMFFERFSSFRVFYHINIVTKYLYNKPDMFLFFISLLP